MFKRNIFFGLSAIVSCACSGTSSGVNSISVGGSTASNSAATGGSGGAVSSTAPTGGAVGTGGASATGGANATGGQTFVGPAPKVAAFNILGAPPAGGGLLLIVGTNLHTDTQVRFGSAIAAPGTFTAGNPDQLTVTIPPSPLLPAVTDGFVDVAVQNPDGQTDTLAPKVAPDGTPWPGNFHYGPPPVATGFSPTSGKGLDVSITGTGFSSDKTGARVGLQVLMSGLTTLFPPMSSTAPAATATSITVSVRADQINPGNYTFTVTNFDGQSSAAPGVFVVP